MAKVELSKQYDPAQYEEATYKAWEKEGIFQPDQHALAEGKTPFVIMLPPPNITGSLHMGHALQDTIMDVLVRYHRMKGDPTLWVPGTDHAAIATNRVIEKQLQEEGVTRQEIGRDAFLQRTNEWYEKTGAVILEQMKRLGASCDWTHNRFTMDDEYYRAVQESFVRYYERGFIYRGNRIVNWCPRCESVVSDLETKYEKRSTKLVTLKYPLADGSGAIEVATTRPETMLGDTAVAVHPEDEQYTDFLGKTVKLPLMNREIPIVADERIDKEFGTGAVKVTPAHDPLDAQIGETHGLDIINVIGENGTMTQQAGQFAGLNVAEARKAVLKALREEGVVVNEEDYQHNAALCERCGTVIEPLISRQWFVDMSKLKKEAMQVVEDDLVQFVPERWKKHFLTWMENVHDWTVSRQIWLGHRVPVWWKPGTRGTNNEEGNFVVSIERPPASAKGFGEVQWEQDPDVLDTWFSSALWPFATLGWPNASDDLKTFYPTSVLVTARDILYLWVARMIFSGLELLKDAEYERPKLEQRIPFHDVFIYPTVLAKTGQRMSKSLGTGVDPLDLITQYGADATRFGLMHQMNFDQQAMKFDEAAIRAARNFANKVWNIARLLETLPTREEVTVADEWIEQRSEAMTKHVTKLIEEYKFGEAARVLHDFVWKDYADWYIEILKVEGSAQKGKQVFLRILTLLHPFMPHITEVLWRHMTGEKQFLATEGWPEGKAKHAQESETVMQRLQDVVSTIRSIRTLLGIAPGTTVNVYTETPVPLPTAAAALSRSVIASEQQADMRRFPLKSGEAIYIGSDEITSTSINEARTKLEVEQKKLEDSIAAQTAMLDNMRGKAAEEVVAEKEAILARLNERLQEIARSLEALS